MKKSIMPILAVGTITLMTQMSDAAVIAAYQPAKNFTYTYGTDVKLIPDTQIVSFAYDQNAPFYGSLDAAEQALSINATLVFWTANADPGAISGFGTVNQPLSTISFKFVNSGTFDGHPDGTFNLLSGTADSANFAVVHGPGGQVTYSAGALDNVVFTSDAVANLSSYFNTAFSITGNVSNNATIFNNFLSQSSSSGTGLSVKLNGNFSAEFVNTPEPGTIALLMGSGVAGTGLLLRRRRAK